MKTLRTLSLAAATALTVAAAGTAEARDQIRIVGSSTIYPFASYVVEELGVTTAHPTPVIESTGSGGGLKLFCAGVGLDTPTSPTPAAGSRSANSNGAGTTGSGPSPRR